MRVCILAAGQGTRMGPYSELTHKGLLPIGNKAVISRIIEQFPEDSHFVFAVGYKKQFIIDYLKIAHSTLKYSIVEVENFDGPGSGPGLSLYSCREELQEPFLFTACDTLILDPIDTAGEGNWVGVQEVEDVSPWCSVKVEEGLVNKIIYKEPADTNLIFTGIGYIADYSDFWEGLEKNGNLLSNELQVNNGLEALIPKGLGVRDLKWADAGNEENYLSLLESYEKNYTFQGKTTDCTYRIGDVVIKFFNDSGVASRRYRRALENKGIFADVVDHVGSFYSYRFHPGTLLSGSLNYSNCIKFLDWVEENLWNRDVDAAALSAETVRNFYLDKTIKRLELFFKRYGDGIPTKDITINGLRCSDVFECVRSVQDLLIDDALPSHYHGDLHSDNVLVCEDGYRLIDWRDSFGDSVDVGDRYYDLAKFYHTLEFSVAAMDNGEFEFSIRGDSVSLEHRCDYTQLDACAAFSRFVEEKGYSAGRIEIINAIIYLNMSPLYDRDLACYLYYLGFYSLVKALDGKA